MSSSQTLVFAWTQPRLEDLGPLLKAALQHPWVASYQVGFGPPLINSSMALERSLSSVASAVDKLLAYLEVCFYDEAERTRLAQLHRRMVVQRMGPVEAEVVRTASAEVLDLSLRLHPLLRAPPAVRADICSQHKRLRKRCSKKAGGCGCLRQGSDPPGGRRWPTRTPLSQPDRPG